MLWGVWLLVWYGRYAGSPERTSTLPRPQTTQVHQVPVCVCIIYLDVRVSMPLRPTPHVHQVPVCGGGGGGGGRDREM